jgi:MerR family redox-sensitive transcriptional activator SoxR
VLPTPERESGQRRYSADVIEQLRMIDVAKHAGFTLQETRALLLADAGSSADSELRELAARKLPEVEALISRAETMRTWLAAATSCTCTTLDICTLFEHAEPDEPAPASASCCRAGTTA